MKKMTTSKTGLDFIKSFEGLRLTAYKPVPTEKYYTIAYGHYGPDVKKGMTITKERADDMFVEDIAPFERLLNKMNINFRQEQFDSLISWLYNLGAGNFNHSTLKKYIVGDFLDEDIAAEFIKWINAGGKPLPGLKKRRIAEANMFLGYDRYYLDEKNNIKKK